MYVCVQFAKAGIPSVGDERAARRVLELDVSIEFCGGDGLPFDSTFPLLPAIGLILGKKAISGFI